MQPSTWFVADAPYLLTTDVTGTVREAPAAPTPTDFRNGL